MAREYARRFVRGHYLFREALKQVFESTVSFEEQTMFKDNYRSIFSRQIEALVSFVYYPSYLSRNTRSFGHIQSREAFRQTARLRKCLADYN